MRPVPDKDRFPSRKNPRLKEFDYSSRHYYFITICTWEKSCIFGTAKDLSPWGETARACIGEIARHFPGVKTDKSVVMPNHVHCILVLNGHGAGHSTIVGQYKSTVSREIRKQAGEITVWQRSFYDEIIRSEIAYQKLWSYIHTNPQNWSSDELFCPALER